MRLRGWQSTQVRLVAAFLGLVFIPSLLLAWFTLRAVDSERRAQSGRVLENYQRYGDYAARVVHYELAELEVAWSDLLTADSTAAADSALRAERFVRAAFTLKANGQSSGIGTMQRLPIPDAAEARDFEARLAVADSAEYEDPAVAVAEYTALASKALNPRLRAIALASLARAQFASGASRQALATARRLRSEYPDAFDFDNQPLDLVAGLIAARALEALDDSAAAPEFAALGDATLEHASELAPSQIEFFRDRAAEGVVRLAPRPPASVSAALAARVAAWNAPRRLGDAFLARKLDRRLLRAVLDEQAHSPRLRYLSDVIDAEPFLVVYRFLPSANQNRIAGIAGLVIDLPHLSSAVLPGFLKQLQLSQEAELAITDDAGRHVIGAAVPAVPAAGSATPDVLRANLGEPFEFWNVVVVPRAGTAVNAVDVRTRAFLAVIIVLLLTIVAGAVLVLTAVRREGRLAGLKTNFVSNVSHELRTPLASIRMYAEMLEMNGERLGDTERRRQLAVIRGECGRLERLIDAVLDFANFTRGTRRFQFEYEEIGPLVSATAEDFRPQAEAAGFTYSVEVEPNLPEVRADRDALRQVVLNLLTNAVKYSEDERWIAVRVLRRGAAVAIQVEDRGIGIEPSEQQRIFEEFYRVDQRLSSPRQGVGLGLTLVRRIAEAHGGRVEVQSAPGRGARFTVWLPAEPATDSTPPAAGSVPEEAKS